MNFYSVLILATIFFENEADVRYENTPQDGHKTAAELAKLIHLVRESVKDTGLGDQDQDASELKDERTESSSNLQQFELDYYMARNKNPQDLKTIMALLQSNYDAQKAHESPGARLHIISNPEVLEEYQRRFKIPAKLYKDIEENGAAIINYKDLLHQRRNAVFRLETSSMEKGSGSNANEKTHINNQKTIEDLRLDDERKDDIYDEKKRNVFDDDDAKDIRKKAREDESLKQDNAWDVITKRYDWDEPKHQNKYDSPKHRKDPVQKKFKKVKADDDWNKVTKQNFDDWDRNDKINRPKKKQWDGERKKPKKLNYDESYDRPKNEKKKRNTDWDVTTYRTTRKREKGHKKRIRDDWDKPFASSYYSKPRPKKTRDSFDNSGGFFGRTPIPFVGRQGIYVDK